MKLSILGIVIGTGLFAGGFAMHDTDFRLTRHEIVSLHPNVYGTDHTESVNPDIDKWEHAGYLMGMVGAAMLTLSIDRLQNSDNSVAKAESRFRTKWGTLIGTGAVACGYILHERGQDDDLQVIFNPYGLVVNNGPVQYIDLRNNPREHLGYFLGATGASLIAHSIQ